MKCSVFIYLFASFFFISAAEKCEKCVQPVNCPLFNQISNEEQVQWLREHTCPAPEEVFGFPPIAKDFICCFEGWEWELRKKRNFDSNDFSGGNGDDSNDGSDDDSDEDGDESYSRNSWAHRPNRRPTWSDRSYGRPNSNSNSNLYTQVPSSNLPYDNGPGYNTPNNYGGNTNIPNYNGAPNGNFGNSGWPQNNIQNYGPNNWNPNFNGPNANLGGGGNYPNGNYPGYGQPTGNMNNPLNNNNIVNAGGQCSRLSSYPVPPQSKCCGLEATSEQQNIGSGWGAVPRPTNPYEANPNPWMSGSPNYPRRYIRETNTVPNITLDNRIAGGKETNLLQFPWTAFLKVTFDYGSKQSAFNCGGSLISSRYVLTAAHCVSEDGARVSDIDVTLAEYDKRTFPVDCVNVIDEGQKCIKNVLMKAEEVIPHPQYDSGRLQNDIALIRLRSDAPYTDYIRPICLPPINVDNPRYSDLRLAVAGWGRNGTVTSQVKQSTVVNLVPQAQCSLSYPHLTEKHLCAAGHSGEDTCKGDSGGPLMMLYEGQYYVSGVVSGKRADTPCGTNVPSLYTNVYHYVDWINRSIRP